MGKINPPLKFVKNSIFLQIILGKTSLLLKFVKNPMFLESNIHVVQTLPSRNRISVTLEPKYKKRKRIFGQS